MLDVRVDSVLQGDEGDEGCQFEASYDVCFHD